MRTVTPLKDFVVMEVINRETSKIVLPENYDKLKMISRFVIKFIGPECVEVEIGDGVVVAPEAIVKFQHNGQDYFMTREENVGAVLREEKQGINS